MNDEFKILNNKQTKSEKQLDNLEQYGRRENIEIHGIAWSDNECTNSIAKKVAKDLNVKLEDSDISTSHRLFTKGKSLNKNQNPSNKNIKQFNPESERHPPNIVRFTNRDKRNELFTKRQKLNSNSSMMKKSSPNFEIRDR